MVQTAPLLLSDGFRIFVLKIGQPSFRNPKPCNIPGGSRQLMIDTSLRSRRGLGLWDCTWDIHLLHLCTNCTAHYNRRTHLPGPTPTWGEGNGQPGRAIKYGNCNNMIYLKIIDNCVINILYSDIFITKDLWVSYRLLKYRSHTLLETKSVVLEDNYNSFPFRIQIIVYGMVCPPDTWLDLNLRILNRRLEKVLKSNLSRKNK